MCVSLLFVPGYEDQLLSDIAEAVKTLHLDLPIKVDGKWGFFYKVSENLCVLLAVMFMASVALFVFVSGHSLPLLSLLSLSNPVNLPVLLW